MKCRYFDIHSHLNLKPLADDVAGVVAHMREQGVGTITVGTNLETSKKAIELAHEFPDVLFATVGIHPTEISNARPLTSDSSPEGEEEMRWQEIEVLAQDSKVVAIGETGLDYFRSQDPDMKAKQVELFKKHIELAVKVGKPLMLHVRASKGTDDAYYDALAVLKEQETKNKIQIKVNFHFFSGSKQCMEDIVAAGYTISVDGPITFTNEYDDMIRACPLESIMAETDAPFAVPEPYRSGDGFRAATKICEPWMVGEVIKRIAAIKEISPEEAQKALLLNVQKTFDIPILGC